MPKNPIVLPDSRGRRPQSRRLENANQGMVMPWIRDMPIAWIGMKRVIETSKPISDEPPIGHRSDETLYRGTWESLL